MTETNPYTPPPPVHYCRRCGLALPAGTLLPHCPQCGNDLRAPATAVTQPPWEAQPSAPSLQSPHPPQGYLYGYPPPAWPQAPQPPQPGVWYPPPQYPQYPQQYPPHYTQQYPWPYPPGAYAPYLGPPPGPRPPRVWTALVAPLVAVAGGLVAAVVVILAAVATQRPDVMADRVAMEEWTKSFFLTPAGFWAAVLPGQAVFLLVALACGWMSPREPTVRRLGMVRGRAPWWTWPVFVLATPMVMFLSHAATSWMPDEPSEHLKLMEEIITKHTGAMGIAVLLTISLLPGLAEEVMFRGYVQRRLLQRWHPVAALACSSAMFAAAHMDPMHVIGVTPLGVWLGVLAWRCGTIWPSVLCHATNNALAVFLSRSGVQEIHFDAQTVGVLAVAGLASALAVFLLVHYGRRPEGARGFEPVPR